MRKLALTLALAALALPLGVATAKHRDPKTFTIKVGDDFFSPTKKTIHKNDVVKWVWVGPDGKAGSTINEHSIVSANTKEAFTASASKTKGTFKVRFKKAGKFTVVCGEHPDDMILKLKVTS